MGCRGHPGGPGVVWGKGGPRLVTPACPRLLPTRATGLKRRVKKFGENPLPSETFWGKSAASQRCLGIAERGCSSGVEHNLAKVGVEGSNPFARSNFSQNQRV